MTAAMFFSICLALLSANAVVADADIVEFGRRASSRLLALKRSSKSRKGDFSSDKAFGIVRRKKSKGVVPKEATMIDELELIEMDKELLFDDMSMSMSYAGGSPSMPSSGGGRPSPQGPAASPNHQGPAVSPNHQGPAVSPNHQGPAASPNHQGPAASPSHQGPAASPSHQGPAASPSHQGPAASPNQQGPAASPSQGQNPSAPSMSTPSASVTPYPTFVRSQTPAQSPSFASPTVSETPVPTFTGAPTITPSPTSTSAPTITANPTVTIWPNDDYYSTFPPSFEGTFESGLSPTTVFDISEDAGGVVIVAPPHDETTVVRLEILYIVEAFVNNTEAFEEDLDFLIFVTAVVASLQGNNSGVLLDYAPTRRLIVSESDPKLFSQGRQLLSSSSFRRSCNATVDDANCFIMEADIVYIVNGDRNADYAAYLAYLSLHDEMGSFNEGLPHVARVEYLAPLPILPPVSLNDQGPSGNGVLSPPKSTITFNPWTVGAAVAMSTGGLMALMVWNRNRRTRNRRHIQLLEDVSVNPPSSPRESAQREIVSHPL